MKSRSPQPSGFVLMEVIVAMTVFALVGIALTQAISQIGQVALESRRSAMARAALASTMAEIRATLELQAGEYEFEADANGVLVRATIEALEEVENQDGQPLNNLVSVQLQAEWLRRGQIQVETAEFLRYLPLYAR
ncbi:MAG: prepilin-type N-terminal cleavage/methylation domain-containing protein [Verrucomicrobiota bacterium]